jgi:hypothetical protein
MKRVNDEKNTFWEVMSAAARSEKVVAVAWSLSVKVQPLIDN